MRLNWSVIATAAILVSVSVTKAETYNLGVGGTWNDAASWNPTSIPNAVGASATFNNAASGSNPAQTANRTITLDGTKTVGSIIFNNDAANAFTNSITTGSGGPLVLDFDGAGAGSATINVPAVPGLGTGNNTISVATRLDDNLIVTVDQITATSAAGALNLTTAISGPGGFTKNGDGLATFGTGAKTYTGPTVLNGGRMRISVSAAPTTTSSFTINAGAQLTLIAANGTYTLGTGSLNLNGNGAISGPFAAFPGAIRQDTNTIYTITNPVDLQSDSSIHVQGSATGSLTLSGNIGGVGGLTAGANPHDANLGQLVFGGTNSYAGGTTVRAGSLIATGASTTAFGIGNITVESANLVFGGSAAKLVIQAGATNAIADTATLSLAGGNVAASADDGYADLDAGINETIAGLVLGGVTQTLLGTYGSTASGATFPFDEFFAGTGVITLAAPAGVSGDYNNNGVVDAADYALWRNGGPLQNDPTAGVQPADYDFWRSRFGATSGSGSGLSAVPEPTSLVLAGMLLSLGLAGRRARGKVAA